MAGYWMGKAPERCDVCSKSIHNTFSDARVPGDGRWGCLCANCCSSLGVSYGLGRGQKYVRQDDGRYMKTEG